VIDQSDTPAPKVSVVDADSLSIGPFTPATLNPEMVAGLGQITAAVRDGVAVALADMGKKVSEQIQVFRRGLTPAPDEPEIDMSPRAVALRARQNRHTGPRGNPRQHRRR
jgi:hypothetical protein